MRIGFGMAAPSLLLAACGGSSDAATNRTAAAPAAGQDRPFRMTEVADLQSPWAMTFLPSGEMLVTEKQGELKLLSRDGKRVTVVPGTPRVDSAGQGGLMDVALAPDFADSGLIYLSWSEYGRGGKGVVLGRGRLDRSGGKARLDDLKPIFRAAPLVMGDGHYSGRIAISPDRRYLFFTAGDRQKFTPAQQPDATLGKVLRLNLDGTPAPGNPLVGRGFHPAIWSYGHRNLLGITFDDRGRLWEQEMGPKGGDEVNLILPGRNYGWPNASNGSHYDGRDIPDHRPGDGYEAPRASWNPVISPGGLLFYNGATFPAWKGSLFIGGLSSESLVRVAIDGDRARKADQWSLGMRVREVEQGPDGAIWLLEDGDDGSRGRVWRLTPAAG